MAPLMNVKQAAECLAVSAATVYELVASGKLRCHRIGKGRGAIRLSEDQLRAYLETTTGGVPHTPQPAPRAGRPMLKHLTID